MKTCLVSLLLILSFFIPLAQADERILSFQSDITVHEDAHLTVKEIIVVVSEAKKIKHGIYRDFPTTYRDHKGNSYTVGFQVRAVQKDSRPEPIHLSRLSNGQRVYIGDKNVFLRPGEYTYVLTYQTDRQLGSFDDFDELYWNVTGNGWDFPIDKVSAEIHLPGDAGRKIINTAAYTGPQGAKGKDFRTERNDAGSVVFSTTRSLGAKEGLTIALSWPKGYLQKPEGRTTDNGAATETPRRDEPPQQGSGVFSVIAGMLVLAAYYLLVWLKAGRDPEAGVIVVRYAPPSDMTPAVMRFIFRMGYDNKGFAAAIIDMAVRGAVSLHEDDGEYVIRKKEEGMITLSAEEKKIADHLFGADKEIRLIKRNHIYISGAINELKAYLRQKYEKIYFLTNRRYFVVGLLLTGLLLFASGFGMAQNRLMVFPFVFICIWLTIWSTGVIVLVREVVQKWRAVIKGRGNGVVNGAGALFLTLFSLPFIGGEIAGIAMMAHFTSIVIVLFLLAAMALNYLFFHLLKAPTRAGRALLDAIEGFRRFLVATEQDRLNMMNPPYRTPQLFEKYLPYALALDVEQQWSEQFAAILAEASAAGETGGYHPSWYYGPAWSSLGAGDFAGNLGDAFAGAIASSSTAPGSSSGSGGGGSSGGGGGGGGGGW